MRTDPSPALPWAPRRTLAPAIMLLSLLSACASIPEGRPPGTTQPPSSSGGQSPTVPPPPPRQPPPPPTAGFRTPQVLNLPGLEQVIGRNTADLTRLFGNPRLDVREEDMRKLQFSGDACVLDVFLYPMRPNAEPTATYVEARRASDGQDVDRVACANALRRR
ncbi:hypothetical protein GRI97_00580 [Altererythrobacter xixiisoli]|uniref:Uncharacterized protein n=2 Tax=Croceibacterium xixiisoli TaxID=1476466 RepID=A0A6I4TNN3_9SPHN|nr:hypothetical protein [Croceibacterium xixiisoli]